MEILTALEMFERRPLESREDVLDVSVSIHGGDAWSEAATAAVMLAGFLDDALTDADLDEGCAHFQSLHSAGIISTDQWRETIDEVISAKLADLEEQGLLEMDSA